MSKRPVEDQAKDAKKRRVESGSLFAHPLFDALQNENLMLARRIDENEIDIRALHRRVEVMEGYIGELEVRLDTVRAVTNQLSRWYPQHATEVIQAVRLTEGVLDEEIQAMLDDLETEDEDPDWFVDLLNGNQ